ncbi:ComEC/Rec2 family competence protein [Egbenema bharatensis]|uniref:ComEC/Rec2 family competence protein n=1 Tax=Egbenema bharatensis TaxID=3463334 RepID=UPI003A8445F9
MVAIRGIIFCSAFILGLLFTGVSGTVREIPVGSIALLLFSILASFLIPRFWRVGIQSWVWAIAGAIAFLAGLYFQWRLPHPGVMDISRLLTEPTSSLAVVVTGKIEISPRLTQSQRIQFELKATQAQTHSRDQPASNTGTNEPAVTGKVYVTVPLLQGTGLYPGQTITITGSLYSPKPATHPGGFDFAQYLRQRGIFAGLSGETIDRTKIGQTQNRAAPPILWQIRQRMIRAQVKGAGVPEGVLLSAMVMGGRSVDVPYAVRESFRLAGLSHTLAASGAHVAVLLGVVMALARRSSVKWQVGLGLGTLVIFVGLAGFQPSVLRAAIMGGTALLALLKERKVKPLGALLVTAVILLVINPLWIWDVGFQLSFLATLGLLVTVPTLSQWLDWLPKGLIPSFAVPIAAYCWTLPILLYAFGVVSGFSVLINVLASPLFTIVSLGGMASGLAALIHPELGRLVASGLYYPAHSLIALAEWGSRLPGSSFAVGRITVLQLVLLYGLMVGVWQWKRSQRYWWIAVVMGIGLVVIPVGYGVLNRFQVTVLATSREPVLVIQARGTVGLINAGQESDAQFTLLPFLQSQGINQIDQAIDVTASEGWRRIAATLPIQRFDALEAGRAPGENMPEENMPGENARTVRMTREDGEVSLLSPQHPIAIGSVTAQLLPMVTPVLSLQVSGQTWLLLDRSFNEITQTQAEAIAEDAHLIHRLPPASVLGWSGSFMDLEVLEAVQPEVVIANARSLSLQTQEWLDAHGVTTYLTGRDGAIQWTLDKGFRAMMQSSAM